MSTGQGRMPAIPPAVPLRTRDVPRPAANRIAAVRPEPVNPGENLFTSQEWQVLRRAYDLSERELAVAILIVEGLSREEIGARLHKPDGTALSLSTVRVYVDRIFIKVRAHDRLGLVLRLVRAYREHFAP